MECPFNCNCQAAADKIKELEAEVLKWQIEAGRFGPGIEAAEATIEELQQQLESERTAHWTCVDMQRNEAEAERDRLWASLGRYGNHATECMMYRHGDCDCGWPQLKMIIPVYSHEQKKD